MIAQVIKDDVKEDRNCGSLAWYIALLSNIILSSDLLPTLCTHWGRALAQRLSNINRYSLKTVLRGAGGFVPRHRYAQGHKEDPLRSQELNAVFLSPPSALTKRTSHFSQVPSTSCFRARRAGSSSQTGSLQALSVRDGPKTYMQDTKKGKRNTRVGEPSCHPFSLSKTRLGEKKHTCSPVGLQCSCAEGF